MSNCPTCIDINALKPCVHDSKNNVSVEPKENHVDVFLHDENVIENQNVCTYLNTGNTHDAYTVKWGEFGFFQHIWYCIKKSLTCNIFLSFLQYVSRSVLSEMRAHLEEKNI